MADYKAVSEALKNGADPAMLCETCPWDRYCITPPSMTAADIEREQQKSKVLEEEREAKARAEGKEPGLPVGSLLTTIMFAGKDLDARVCPVFSNRLRSSGGRDIVDSMKVQMQAWDDGRV